MKKNHDQAARQGRIKKRKGYWSVMLVGEHGRVIPFKYFKELAIGVLVLLIMTVSALLIIGFWYMRQGRQIAQLQTEIVQVREQAAKLRDEKDLLLAEMVIGNKSVTSETQTPAAAIAKVAPALDSGKPAATNPAPMPPAPASKIEKQAPVQPAVQMAKISHFGADYDPAAALLTVKFRLHNATPSRKPLSGRIVVVLGDQDDSGFQRVSIPSGALSNGEPSAKQGHAFNINNYRTMEFKLGHPEMPIPFRVADIFIFSSEGESILKESFPFEIAHKEAAPKPPEKGESPSPKVSDPPTEPAGTGIEPAAPPPAAEPLEDQHPAAGAPSDDTAAQR
jgi:hypothetical protein